MILSRMGEIVQGCWSEIPKHYTNGSLDAFVIMPNHVHGVLVIGDLEKPGWEIQNHKRVVLGDSRRREDTS